MSDYAKGRRELSEWIRERGVTRVRTEDHGMRTDAEGWDHFAYTVHLSGNGVEFAFPYMQGLAHGNSPRTADVVAALLSDAGTVANNETFEQWADEFGYDTDSRRSFDTYNKVVDNTAKLRKILGASNLQRTLDAVRPILERAGL